MSPIRVPRNFTPLINCIAIFVLVAAVFAFPQPARAESFIVNSLWDDDDGVCDATHCTLREAINAAGNGDIIWISIASGSPNWVIYLDSELPPIWQSNLTIDATSMPPFLGGPSVVLVGDEDVDYGFLLEGNNITIRGFKFSSFWGPGGGAGVITTGNHNYIEGNCFNNSTYGVILQSDENVVRDNHIGVMPWGSASPNDEAGILIAGSENDIETNVIAYNGGDGIAFGEPEGLSYNNNTFTRNSIYENGGLGINVDRQNGNIDLPYLANVGLTEVTGEGCAGCVIELFLAAPDPTDYGEGQTFIGEVVAGDDRTFSISLDEYLTRCDPVTATATSPIGDATSEFSLIERAGECMTFEMPPLVEAYLTVNTVDDGDDGTCNEDHCSLREAINYANRHLGRDVISFDIPGAGPHEILIAGEPLPALLNDQTVIDGSTEPDYTGRPVVWIVNERSWRGLYVESQRNTIRGLGITGFDSDVDAGLLLSGGFNLVEDNVIVGNGGGISVHSNHNTLTGNFIGVTADGVAQPNYSGIFIVGDDNQIGLPGDGNVISGNTHNGLSFRYSHGNTVRGNVIGGDAGGTTAIPNGRVGIYIADVEVVIGGLGSGEGNIIYGNGSSGIYLGNTALDTLIAGNVIAENGADGIVVASAAPETYTFTQNSIYNNGELGIETNRADDHIAELERASRTSISGTVDCAGCTVELFQAAPDPTGYGEGQTYLGETTTGADGTFTFEFSGLEVCDEITATVTDTDGQTSEFSENALVACMRAPGSLISAVGLVGVLILTIVVVVLRRLGPETPPWLVPGVAGGGLLLLVLVLGGAAVNPSVQLDFGPSNASLPIPQPACSEYLDPEGYAPAADQLFGLEDDPAMRWTPGADAPEGAEWLVEVQAPNQRLYTLITADTSVNLSAFQLEPRAGARFDWSVRLVEQGEAACWPEERQSLWFENPVIVAYENLPEAEPVEAACTPVATAIMNANCRLGPSLDYAEMAILLEGETAGILGRSEDFTWWNVRLVDTQQVCWVWSEAVEAECTDDLSVVEAPPLPTPTPTTPPPVADTTAPPVPSPVSPTGGTTLACSSSALLNWSTVNDPSGISGYTVEVQRSSDQITWSSAPGSPLNATGDKATIQVDCGWYYRWHVRATDGAGNTSAWSNWASFNVTFN